MPRLDHFPAELWEQLARAEVHPLRVKILEAIEVLDKPLSPSLLVPIVGEYLGMVAYHTKELAGKGLIVFDHWEPRRALARTSTGASIVDSYLRGYFLTALGFDLAVAGDCTPKVAVDLIAGARWWERLYRAVGG